jgi:hypothetical protein
MLPGGLGQAGGFCSPGFFDLEGSPDADPLNRSSTPVNSPLVFRSQPPLSDCDPKLQGFSIGILAISPETAPAKMNYHTIRVPNLLRKRIGYGLYFRLGA